jgi:hypothetical protein
MPILPTDGAVAPATSIGKISMTIQSRRIKIRRQCLFLCLYSDDLLSLPGASPTTFELTITTPVLW